MHYDRLGQRHNILSATRCRRKNRGETNDYRKCFGRHGFPHIGQEYRGIIQPAGEPAAAAQRTDGLARVGSKAPALPSVTRAIHSLQTTYRKDTPYPKTAIVRFALAAIASDPTGAGPTRRQTGAARCRLHSLPLPNCAFRQAGLPPVKTGRKRPPLKETQRRCVTQTRPGLRHSVAPDVRKTLCEQPPPLDNSPTAVWARPGKDFPAGPVNSDDGPRNRSDYSST